MVRKRTNDQFVKKRNWFRKNHEKQMLSNISEKNQKPEQKNNTNKKEWKTSIKKFAFYGAMGYGIGKIIGHSFANFGMTGGLIATAMVATAMTLAPRIFKSKKKDNSKMGLAISLEMAAGEIVFPTVVGTAAYLSGYVTGPVTGFLVGFASMIAGYLVSTPTFYGSWFLSNRKKYNQTGFGKINDLKNLPLQIKELIIRIIKRQPIMDNKESQAESFLSEAAKMHGSGLVFGLPYYLIRPIAGLIAGFTPDIFLQTFITTMLTVSPYIFPIYVNFYRVIEPIVNSKVSVVDDVAPQNKP